MNQQVRPVSGAATQPGLPAETGQYLTFTMGNEDYGVDILCVQEIKGWSGVTHIPNTAPHVKGVMNLRGTVIPVVDLRVKFAMPAREYDKFTVIIVATVRERIVGLVVDAVSDVLDVPVGEVRPVPEFGGRADTRFIRGMAAVGDKLVVLLDMERLFSDSDLSSTPNLSN